jgi:apolipoprotein N-acyltransferase
VWLAAVSGALYALAFPPLPLGFVAAVALVPLLSALHGATPKTAFKLASVFGIVAHAALLWWVVGVHAAILLGMVYLGLRWGLIGWLFAVVGRRSWTLAWVSFPALWLAFEWLATLGEMAFPWATIGTTQYAAISVIQISSVTGVWGVSLWLVAINVLIAVAWCSACRYSRRLVAASVLVVLVAPFVYGSVVLSGATDDPNGRTVTVALLQGNVDPYEKWAQGGLQHSFSRYDSLASELVSRGGELPDLVVWPETALPAYALRERRSTAYLKRIVSRCPTWHLASSPDYIHEQRGYVYFNSAYLLSPAGEVEDKYDKILLLPFSERIPFSGSVKFLSEINLGEADFSPGTRQTIFRTSDLSFGVMICIESEYPDFARRYVSDGADLLVVTTNDGWFGRTPGPYHHAASAVFRAVETRTPLVRCANNGVSYVVDPYGRRRNVTNLCETEIVTDTVALRNGPHTIYTRFGDYLPKFCVAVSLLAIVSSFFSRKRE